ncbi:uncharacterized protein LOC142229953 [Haematobia irritans]|uniref:uncharacterized protein LOC142229953 n=1 Tax=Haematobia irritans TaxID=7368 RepID=UPI003F503D93
MSARRKFSFDNVQLISFCAKIESEISTYKSVATLEVKHTELERRWNNLLESFENIMAVAGENSDDEEDTKSFDEATSKYQECKVKIIEAVQEKSQPRNLESTRIDTSTVHHGVSSLKLPPCDTQPFEGGYSKWPAFRDIFQAVFINHPGLSDAQKLYHLRSKTRSEAWQIVQRFDLTDANFTLAWNALKNRYENTRILVHQQMKKFFGIQVAPCETAKSIRNIQSSINDCVAIFKSYKLKTDDWDPILVHWCSTRLPEETLRAWEDSLSDHKELPTWSQLDTFLSKRTEMLETITDLKKPNNKDNNNRSQTFYAHSENDMKYSCKKFKKDHALQHCKHFKSLSPKERQKYVYANKYCANCLSTNHFKSKCTSERTCAKCQQKHHTMLHQEKLCNISSNRLINENSNSENVRRDSQPSTSGQQGAAIQIHMCQNSGTTVLPTALIGIVHAGETFLVRALLDAGSERSFLSRRIQQKLGLPTQRHNTKISGLGGTIVGNSQQSCHVNIKSRKTNFSMNIDVIIVPKLTHFLPANRVNITKLNNISDLDLADPYFYKPSPIDVIIGSDYLPQINMEGVRFDVAKGLEARQSKFGWYLSGPMPVNEVRTFATVVQECDDTALHEQMRKFWELENLNEIQQIDESEAYCEDYYKKTTYREDSGRYVVRLPFRSEYPQNIYLSASKSSASAQYFRMEKTLEKSHELKNEYNRVLQEYIDLGHMEPVQHREESGLKQSSFFLPHHAVIRPDRKSTKVRVVFNGSKKTSSGYSLNNVLLPGPTLIADLMQIIIGWRFYKFVFTGDIEKMYRQVLVHPEDRKYQLIFHRPVENEAVKTYQLKTVTFGINCAPFLALRTLIQLSEDCNSNQILASNILKNETYVDDVLSGGHTIDEAVSKQVQLTEVLNSASFPLKKITSNCQTLLSNLAREDLLDEEFLKFDESSATKTLGIRWNAKTDTFFYKVKEVLHDPSPTKRQVLSVIARLYDPLGWLGPIIVIAKVFMQKLWQDNVDWNDRIPENLYDEWKAFIEHLPAISTLKIPRWIGFSPGRRVQVHGFSDASEKAYCGAIYIRVECENGEIASNLLMAKTRVAPLRCITIPKLELCGALLMAKLLDSVKICCEYERFYWTDSSIVLGWLQKSPQVLKTFVSNRIAEILRISDVKSWRHVKTEENPADLGTRGSTPQDLQHNLLWWHGPPWLKTAREQWSPPRTFEPTELETKRTSNLHIHIFNEEIITRFSSLPIALRVVCYIYRFINRSRKKSITNKITLQAEEIENSKRKLIVMSQKLYYPQDYELLLSKSPLNNKSSILSLTPYLDEFGQIRIGGRLEHADLSFNERHPVLIPDKSHFATLLVRYCHEILLHGEHQVMLRAIRQGYYIPKLRNAIRKCVRTCRTCTVYKHKFQEQLMADLPQERVKFSLPFTYTGVDFAGPFTIKSSPLKNAKLLKGYAAVFVCFSTRSVHLETCSDLSTDAFLAAFSRFVGRRGLPKTIFSDNGRNFVGANRKLLHEHSKG